MNIANIAKIVESGLNGVGVSVLQEGANIFGALMKGAGAGPIATLINGRTDCFPRPTTIEAGSNGQTLIDEGHQLVQEGMQLIQQGNVQQGMQLIQDGAALEMQGGQGTGQGGGGLVTNTQPVSSSDTANTQPVSGSTGQSLIDDGHQLVQEGLQLIQQGNVQQGMELIKDGTALEMQGAQGTGQGAASSSGSVNGSAPANAANSSNGSSNVAQTAESFKGQWAANLESSGQLPMTPGVDPTECCANFVSAVLIKAGMLPSNMHTNLVSGLQSNLQQEGWTPVNKADAKPGDVMIVNIPGGEQHTEIVASNDNGKITLIGSNNTNGGSGPQQVSYDSYTANNVSCTIYTPPS